MDHHPHNDTQGLEMNEKQAISKGWQAFQLIFWTCLSMATLIGNGLVLSCVVMKQRRSSSTIKFYGSLSLGDLLVGK